MFATLFRTIILYLCVIVGIRIMGKRQIGELQPGELVITIVISECAAIPIQDLSRPVINGIISIFTLIILEVILSTVTLKLPLARRVVNGCPTVVIYNGKIDQKAMRRLRLSVDDIVNNLRQKGIFRLEDVAYAIVETDGNLSILPVPQKTPADASMLNAAPADDGLPCVVIGDGVLHPESLVLCQLTEQEVADELQRQNIRQKDVFVLTSDRTHQFSLIKKEGRK